MKGISPEDSKLHLDRVPHPAHPPVPVIPLALPPQLGGASWGSLPVLHRQPVRGARAALLRGGGQTRHVIIRLAGQEGEQGRGGVRLGF